jgi:hypothetical protein
LLHQIDTRSADSASTPADGLREALRVGTSRAVEQLGRNDGYLGSREFKIPIPRKLETLATALKAIGADDEVEQFVTSMNRAAEAAAPVAKSVFVDAIRRMSFEDAMEILKGSEHEATDYFRASAGPRLTELFSPIVDDKLQAVGATRSFNRLMERTRDLPFLDEPVFDLESYVTERALDGLFLKLAQEEARIRKEPLARTTALLKQWFGGG